MSQDQFAARLSAMIKDAHRCNQKLQQVLEGGFRGMADLPAKSETVANRRDQVERMVKLGMTRSAICRALNTGSNTIKHDLAILRMEGRVPQPAPRGQSRKEGNG